MVLTTKQINIITILPYIYLYDLNYHTHRWKLLKDLLHMLIE